MGYGEQDAQLGGVHHLPDDEGAQVGHPDTVRRLPDGLAGDQTGVHDELDSFLALAGLEIAQDDVELVHELVVEKAQGVQHVAGTGELVGQLAHLRLVVEDVAILFSAAFINASIEDKQSAIFCCSRLSEIDGIGNNISENCL